MRIEAEAAKASETGSYILQRAEQRAFALFDVDMAAMGAMMADPEFHKLIENYVEEHIPYSITPINPPA